MREYWDKYNLKFEKKPESEIDAHVPLLPGQDLDSIVCFEWTRKSGKDFAIRWENRLLRVLKNQTAAIHPGIKLLVQKWLDGTVHLWYNDIELEFKEIPPDAGCRNICAG